jgi:hypothetical protein
VATLLQNNINLYETPQDIETSKSYTIVNADELSLVMRRFVSMAAMLVTHPDMSAKFSELSTTCIQLATDLRTAMKVSRDTRTYPDVVLPSSKYSTAMKIYTESRKLRPELPDFLVQELQRWEEDSL